MTNIHVNKCPTGRYNFVGTLPAALGDVVIATRAAILGNATIDERGPKYEIMAIKFPTFNTRAAAILHADSRGFEVSGNRSTAS